MTPEQLKASILQMAISGKLVEQRPEEDEVDILLSFIRKRKDEKVTSGELKAEKPLPEIKDEEKPFDIPESWRWVRLGDYCEKVTDQVASGSFASLRENVPSLKEPNYAIMVKTADFSNGFSSNLTYTTEHGYNFLSNSNLFGGELILSNIGSIGKCFIVPDLGTKMTLAPNAIMLRLADNSYRDYLYHFILSRQGYSELLEISSGTTMKKFNKTDLKKILIPVPPLEEQHRIVAKIEEILPFIDRYAEAYEKLEKFNAKFPEDMKKSILQYAIQGKLVEQRAEEGTAEELYQQIQEEKQKLIKEGKIKKEKPLMDITEDEIPFDIPESWKWVRVGGLFSHNTGKAMNASAKKVDKPGAIRKFITTSNVYWNTLDLESVKEMFFSDDELERCTITKGDLLMCEGGAYYGRTAIWSYDYDICFQNHVHRVRPYLELDLMFFYYVFYFYRNTGKMQSKGTAMPGLSSIALHNMVIPLPPLEEQKRIVAKIEELLPYCDQLIK